MAVKDHSLDEKIVKAAREEFMQHGFQKASLHKIAEKAGLTTGALYTRYQNKDALFCSLLQPALQTIQTYFEPLRENYEQARRTKNPEDILKAIQAEEKIYLEMMFAHYDECVLFFCRSDGSSVQTMLEEMMEEKAQETILFLQSIAKHPVDFDGVSFILTEQFYYYRKILQKGYPKEKAFSCMKTVENFLEAGWKALFEEILRD